MKEKKVGHYSLGCQLDSIPKTKKQVRHFFM